MNLREKFEKWMITKEKKSPTTAYRYKMKIEQIAEDYSRKNGQKIDLYEKPDLITINTIQSYYLHADNCLSFGTASGMIGGILKAYKRFLEDTNSGSEVDPALLQTDEENTIAYERRVNNFTYKNDVKKTLILQIEELFPEYTIFGDNDEGIDYTINGKTIDILLENKAENKLLAIEINAGQADYNVSAQISLHMGMLFKQFPGKEIYGVIIAAEIDESLKIALLTNKNVKSLIYKMKIMLEESA
jgi:hypothetical protein